MSFILFAIIIPFYLGGVLVGIYGFFLRRSSLLYKFSLDTKLRFTFGWCYYTVAPEAAKKLTDKEGDRLFDLLSAKPAVPVPPPTTTSSGEPIQ